MLSDLEVKYSVSSALSCTHCPVGGTEEKCLFDISAAAVVDVVMFLFSVWKVPLGEYYEAR